MSWPGGALRTMPYPDITLVGLESNGLGELPHEDDLTTLQNQANHTIMPKSQLYTQKCIRQISKCSMHVSNRKVVYKGDIDQRSMPKNFPILGSETPPVISMACFTSQLMNLRPNFVRLRVPSQSDHVIPHMVRLNTEAYAHI